MCEVPASRPDLYSLFPLFSPGGACFLLPSVAAHLPLISSSVTDLRMRPTDLRHWIITSRVWSIAWLTFPWVYLETDSSCFCPRRWLCPVSPEGCFPFRLRHRPFVCPVPRGSPSVQIPHQSTLSLSPQLYLLYNCVYYWIPFILRVSSHVFPHLGLAGTWKGGRWRRRRRREGPQTIYLADRC